MRYTLRYIIRLAACLLVLTAASATTSASNSRATPGLYPTCEEACDQAASCAEDCEYGVEYGWVFTTCGEWQNGWDGGYCEVPEDLYDTYVEPLVTTTVEVLVAEDENDPLATAWSSAIADIDAAWTSGGESWDDVDAAIAILDTYGLLDGFESPQPLTPSDTCSDDAEAEEVHADSPDGSTAPMAAIAAPCKFDGCGDKWWRVAAKAGKAAVLLGGAAAAGWVAINVPGMQYNATMAAGRFGFAAGWAIGDAIVEAQQPCVSS